MKSIHKFYKKSLRRVKEVWNNADGTTIFDLKRTPCRAYPFELYFNLFLTCARLCFYFLLLFFMLFVARAFSYFLFARAYIIVLYSDVGRKLSINGFKIFYFPYLY